MLSLVHMSGDPSLIRGDLKPAGLFLNEVQGYMSEEDKAEVRRIELGQSTPSTAVIVSGLTEGETVISEGVQRVRPGQPVAPAPATPMPPAPGANPHAATGNAPGAKP